MAMAAGIRTVGARRVCAVGAKNGRVSATRLTRGWSDIWVSASREAGALPCLSVAAALGLIAAITRIYISSARKESIIVFYGSISGDTTFRRACCLSRFGVWGNKNPAALAFEERIIMCRERAGQIRNHSQYFSLLDTRSALQMKRSRRRAGCPACGRDTYNGAMIDVGKHCSDLGSQGG
jgi:hypothetical protein